MNTCMDIRRLLSNELTRNHYTSVDRETKMTELVGGTTIEVINASFIANEDVIFGKLDDSYVAREHAWYDSQSLNVNDILGGPPKVWAAVASTDGTINSNYGWCVYSEANGSQYNKVRDELRKNPASRRAIIIYTRPTMWLDYDKDGRSDFMCTNSVQYLIRDGELHAIVQMRSNDAIFGYKNDRAWQYTVLQRLSEDLDVPIGNLYWNVGSLHVYARHFYLVDHYTRTFGADKNISQSDYRKLYPDSRFNKQA